MDGTDSWAGVKAALAFCKRLPRVGKDTISSSGNTVVANPDPVCPDRLKVFIGTWNMYGRLPDFDLSTFLTPIPSDMDSRQPPCLDQNINHPYHLVVIGTQECEHSISGSLIYSSKEAWEKRLKDYLGVHYDLIESETMAGLHLAVFVWKPVSDYVKGVHCERVKTGWGNLVGNKGAVAVSVLFGTRSLLFINCHLRAHQNNVEERNANVKRILHDLEINDFAERRKSSSDRVKHKIQKLMSYRSSSASQKPASQKPTSQKHASQKPASQKQTKQSHHKQSRKPGCVTTRFDHVFIFGDTNYRVDTTREEAIEKIKENKIAELLKYDELRGKEEESWPIPHFKEHTIHFLPTYKLQTYDSSSASSISSKKDLETPSKQAQLSQQENHTLDHTNIQYDSGPKKRVPSWTDRILWHDRNHQDNVKTPTEPSTKPSPSPQAFPTKSRTSFGMIKPKPFSQHFSPPGSPKQSPDKETTGTKCWKYDSVLDKALYGASDHMPVIGVYGVYFDEWKVQPRQSPTSASKILRSLTFSYKH